MEVPWRMEGAPKGGGYGRIRGGGAGKVPKGRGPWREKEAGKQRGTLEGGRGPWVLQILAWREEGAPEGGGGSGGRRGPRGRRGPSRKEGALEGRGNPWRVEVLVQSVDGGPQRDERDSRGWSPGGGGSWRAEGGPGEWRGSLRAEGGPKEWRPRPGASRDSPGPSGHGNTRKFPALQPCRASPRTLSSFSCPQDPPWQSAPQGQEGPGGPRGPKMQRAQPGASNYSWVG